MGKKSRSRSKKRKTNSQSSDDEPESRTDEQSSKSKGKKKKRKDKVKKDKKEKHSKAHRSRSRDVEEHGSDLKSEDSKRSRSRKAKAKDKKKNKEKDRAKDNEKDKEKQNDKREPKDKGGKREKDIEKDRSHDKDKVRKKDKRKDKEKEKEREKEKEKKKEREKGKEKSESKRKNGKRRSSSQSSQSRRDKKHSRGGKRSRSSSESSSRSRSSRGGLKSARKRAAGAWDAKSGGEAPASSSQAIVARASITAAPVPPPPGGFRIQSFEELLQQVRSQGTTISSTAQAGANINLALPARPLSAGMGSREADYGRRDEVFPEPSPEILSKANAQAKKEEKDGRDFLRKTGLVPTGPPGLPTGVLVLNQKFVDFLIGPGGQSLAAINYAAGVSIALDQSHMWEGYTIARIYGAEENAQRAKLAIEFKTTQWIPRTGVVRKAGPTGGPVGFSGWQHQANSSPAIVGIEIPRPATSTSVAL